MRVNRSRNAWTMLCANKNYNIFRFEAVILKMAIDRGPASAASRDNQANDATFAHKEFSTFLYIYTRAYVCICVFIATVEKSLSGAKMCTIESCIPFGNQRGSL